MLRKVTKGRGEDWQLGRAVKVSNWITAEGRLYYGTSC